MWTGLSRAAEKQDISVRVGDLETAQAVVRIRERCAESRAVIGKVGGQSIGVWRIDESVPTDPGMALGIRQRRHVRLGLNEELRSIAEEDGKKGILSRLLKRRLKSQRVAIEGDGSVDVADDEER